jgi:phosphopantetheinyl transferase (holo-ACP synthase)
MFRWAAKEAAFKAHPHLRLGFHDVLILPPGEMQEQTGDHHQLLYRQQAWQATGAPVAVIKPGGGRRDQIAMVSISHDGNYASAVCIGFELGPEGGDRERRSGWFSRLSRLWL